MNVLNKKKGREREREEGGEKIEKDKQQQVFNILLREE